MIDEDRQTAYVLAMQGGFRYTPEEVYDFLTQRPELAEVRDYDPSRVIYGVVDDTGGGYVHVILDRATGHYPENGAKVRLTMIDSPA